MMKSFLIHSSISLFVSVLVLGCNETSDYDSSSSSKYIEKVSSINGKAIDGYLVGSTVCLDLNNDQVCQNDEPKTTTDKDGSYTLAIEDADLENKDYNNAQIIVYGGFDKDDPNEEFHGLLSTPNDGSGYANITPMTSVVSAYLQKSLDDSLSLSLSDIQRAFENVANGLGTTKEDITKDPLALDSRESLNINLQLQKALENFKIADKDLKDSDIYSAFAIALDTAPYKNVTSIIKNIPKSKLGELAFKVKELALTSVQNIDKIFQLSSDKDTKEIRNILRVHQIRMQKEILSLILNATDIENEISQAIKKEKLTTTKFEATDYKEEMAYQIIQSAYEKNDIEFQRDKIDVSTIKENISFDMDSSKLNDAFQDDLKVGIIAKDAIKLQDQKNSFTNSLEQTDCTKKIKSDLSFIDSFPSREVLWEQTNVDVNDIAQAFNKARSIDTTIIKELKMPTQLKWNALNSNEKALFLLNKERLDRGIKPFEGISAEVKKIASRYATTLYDNNETGHYAEGNPKERLNNSNKIASNQDFFNFSENIYTAKKISNEPIAKAIYNWIYADKTQEWEDRKLCFAKGLNDNSGEDGEEGLIGIGHKQGIVVLNIFDPSSSWKHETTTRISLCLSGESSKYTQDLEQKVIMDTTINLMWQNESPTQSDSEYRFALSVQDAKDKCAYMSTDTLSSSHYTDWRLPTKSELDAFNRGIKKTDITLNTHWVGNPTEVADGSYVTQQEGKKFAYRCVRDIKKANDLKLVTNIDVVTNNQIDIEVQGKAGADIFLNDGVQIIKKATLDDNGSAIINLDTSGEDGDKIFNLTQKEDGIEIGRKLSINLNKDTKPPKTGAKINLQSYNDENAILPSGQLKTNSNTPTLLVYSSDPQKPWPFLSKIKVKIDGTRYTPTQKDNNGYWIVPITKSLEAKVYDIEVSISDYAKNTRISVFSGGLKVQ